MDATAHYRHLLQLGREEFLASSATAALVRYRSSTDDPGDAVMPTMTSERAVGAEETVPSFRDPGAGSELGIEIHPLTKKPGASFPDRITIGRTPNNDIEVVNHSVSRLHAYVRHDGKAWVVADAGSKNGSWLDDASLEPRKERPLISRSVIRIGDVDLTFLVAADLFSALGGT